jgi:hypothetical protein
MISFQVLNLDWEEMAAIAAIMLDPRAKFKILRFEVCTFTLPASTIIREIAAKSGVEMLM